MENIAVLTPYIVIKILNNKKKKEREKQGGGNRLICNKHALKEIF